MSSAFWNLILCMLHPERCWRWGCGWPASHAARAYLAHDPHKALIRVRQVREDAARGEEDSNEHEACAHAEQQAAEEVGQIRAAEQGREGEQADAHHDERDGDDGDALAFEPLDAREHLERLVAVVKAQVFALVLLAVEQLAHGDAEGAAQLAHDPVVRHAFAALPLRDGLVRDAQPRGQLRLREVGFLALASDERADGELVHDRPPGSDAVRLMGLLWRVGGGESTARRANRGEWRFVKGAVSKRKRLLSH